MAYSKSYKISESEKRLNSLRQQLYGKVKAVDKVDNDQKNITTYSYSQKNLPSSKSNYPNISDLSYLRSDLIKIALLGIGGIALQLILFFSIKNNLITITF